MFCWFHFLTLPQLSFSLLIPHAMSWFSLSWVQTWAIKCLLIVSAWLWSPSLKSILLSATEDLFNRSILTVFYTLLYFSHSCSLESTFSVNTFHKNPHLRIFREFSLEHNLYLTHPRISLFPHLHLTSPPASFVLIALHIHTQANHC